MTPSLPYLVDVGVRFQLDRMRCAAQRVGILVTWRIRADEQVLVVEPLTLLPTLVLERLRHWLADGFADVVEVDVAVQFVRASRT